MTALSSGAIAGVTPLELAEAHEAFAASLRESAARRDAELRTWVNQRESPLGPKRHCRIVRARRARGDSGAAIAGRLFLLSTAALNEELSRLGSKQETTKASAASDLRAQLGLVVGGRK